VTGEKALEQGEKVAEAAGRDGLKSEKQLPKS